MDLSPRKTITSYVTGLATRGIKNHVRKFVVAIVCGVIALVLFLGALFYWLDTLHYWLAGYWGDIGATAAIGGLLFVLALFLALVASFQLKSKPKPVETSPAGDAIRDMLLVQYGSLFRRHRIPLLLGGALLGLLTSHFAPASRKKDRRK